MSWILIISFILSLHSVCYGDIKNIKIDNSSPVWQTLNSTESDFPESAVIQEDEQDLEAVGTTDSSQIPYYDVRQGGSYGQESNNEDLSTSYTPGYCRCINKYYCTGANNKVVRVKRAVNTPPCRNRDDVMCCLTTGPGCGVPANFPYFNPYPLYGEANYGDHPWTAMIMDVNNQMIYGLGIVISWRVVLTTARNVQNLPTGRSGKLKVRLGEWDLSSGDEPFKPQEFSVTEIIIHPQFNPRTYQNDIAILKLATFVDLSSFPSIRSGCIARPGDMNDFVGAKCLVAGWGAQPSVRITNNNNGKVPPPPPAPVEGLPQQGQIQRNILKEVDLTMVEGNICQDALRRNIRDPQFLLDQRSFICAGGDQGKGLCQGDEGAALVCKDRRSERYTVVGMASWATTCGQGGFPVIFTKISNYYDWIKSVDPQIGQ